MKTLLPSALDSKLVELTIQVLYHSYETQA